MNNHTFTSTILCKTLILAFIIFTIGCKYSKPKSEKENWNWVHSSISSKEKANLNEYVNNMFSRISSAYKKNDEHTFYKTTIELLVESNRYPIFYLDSTWLDLKDRLVKDGIEPYMSYLLDYGFRLEKIRTEQSISIVDEIRELLKSAEVQRFDHKFFFKNSKDEMYYAYSGNMGWAITNLLYSDYGSSYISQYDAELTDFVSLVGDALNCKACALGTMTDNAKIIGMQLANNTEQIGSNSSACDVINGLMAASLNEQLLNPSSRPDNRSDNFCKAIRDGNNSGFSQFNCMIEAINEYKQDTDASPLGSGAALIRRLEEYIECRQNNGGGPLRNSPVKDKMGWYFEGDKNQCTQESPCTSQDEEGNRKEKVESTITKDGEEGKQTTITTIDKRGVTRKRTTIFRSKNRRVEKQEEYDENGIRTFARETDESYDDQGNRISWRYREKQIDGDKELGRVIKEGNRGTTVQYFRGERSRTGRMIHKPITKKEYDRRRRNYPKNNSTPNPESNFDPCAYMLSEKEAEIIKRGGDLGPLINPDPSNPNTDPALTRLIDNIARCLIGNLGNRVECDPRIRCADQTCDCGKIYEIELVDLPIKNRCNQIQCGPDQKLNPLTCQCVGYDDVGELIGVTPGLYGSLR